MIQVEPRTGTQFTGSNQIGTVWGPVAVLPLDSAVWGKSPVASTRIKPKVEPWGTGLLQSISGPSPSFCEPAQDHGQNYL